MLTSQDKDKVKYGEKVSVKQEGFSLEAFVSPFNRRVRLVDYQGPQVEQVPRQLIKMAGRYDFATKVFAKVPKYHEGHFLREGFNREGEIRGFFDGTDASVVAYFDDSSRQLTPPDTAREEDEILKKVRSQKPRQGGPRKLKEGYNLVIAESPRHFEDLAHLYTQVFKTYPFPIFDPEYLEKTARSHILYGIVYDDKGNAVAAASAEMDREHRNAEMTDFATLPSQRGNGLAGILLDRLEDKARQEGISYFYTIARSRSFGMNRVFRLAGYQFTGKLKNNCSICGQLENMSIWCKTVE